MRQLTSPPHVAIDVFDRCVEERPDDRDVYIANRDFILGAIADHQTVAQALSWFSLPRVPRGAPQRVVAGTLTKWHMTSLYADSMVGTSGAARRIYDDIMVAANGQCPFCGGIGQVHTLDHYLPKSNFPLYSVLPTNLVPCCRDCNTGKGAAFGMTAESQPLHPYIDNSKFFSQRWVRARVEPGDPIVLEFYCDPPAAWNPTEQARVQSHFRDYDLGRRFRIQAGAEVTKVVGQRRGTLRGLSREGFRDYLLEAANEAGFDLNGWNRTAYAALADTEWFWQADP